MDLNSIAQSGKDPKSGRYLTTEERKEAFRRSLGKKVSSSSKYVSALKKESAIVKRNGGSKSDGGKGGALTKRYNFKVIEQLIGLKKIADELLKTKQEKTRLESKFAAAQRTAAEREKKRKEESDMESRPAGSGKNIFKSIASKGAATVAGGLFGILKSVIAYGILDWISKPENRQAVETFAKIFMGIFKFFSAYVGTMVDSLLGGFTRLFGGGSILERVFGALQLIFGIFLFKGFTRVLHPQKLIGDIAWAIKNAKNFKNLFGSLFSKNLKGVGDAIKQIFPKTASIFKKGLQGALKRVFLKVFGKGIFTFLKPFVKTITKTIVRPLAKAVTKVPVIGALLAIPINMFLGDPIDKAAVKAVGAALGTLVAGALGTIIPFFGTSLGGFAGGLLGDFLAGWLYDTVLAPLGKTLFGGGGKTDQPQLNTGGIASGPDSGYDVTLHGTEAVIPIDKLKDIVLLPYKTVASIIIGSTLAVLKSMGPVGSMIAPIALQMFNPFIRVFGLSIETFSSGLGKGANLLMSPAGAKESENPADYLQESKGKPTGREMNGRRGTKPSTEDDELPDPVNADAGNYSELLDMIAGVESTSSGGYEAFNRGGSAGGHVAHGSGNASKVAIGGVTKPLTQRTVKEIMDLQARGELHATGRYQIIQKTLNGLMNGAYGSTGVNLNDKYDAKTQDKLAIALINGRIRTGANITNFRNEWIGLTHVPDAKLQSAIDKVKNAPKASQGGKIEDPGVLRLFDDKGRKVKNTAPGHSEGGLLEFASGGIIQSAKKAVAEGRRGPATPPCASWVRMVLGMAGHPAAEKRTQKGDLDPDGTAYNGRNFAASFAGSDMGTVINSQSALQPGDVVLHKNTYGSYPPGSVTHVSIASDKPGKILHQSTSGGAPKEGGIWNFKAGIRLGGSGSIGSADADQESGKTSTSPTTGSETKPEPPALDTNMLKDLYTILTGKSSTETPTQTPPTPPTPPEPSLPKITAPSKSSALPSMSSQFSLDKKMSAAHGVQMPTTIINKMSSTNLGTSIQVAPLNNMTISETANLNLL